MTTSTIDPSEVETKELTYPVYSTLNDVGVDPTTDPDNTQIAAPSRNYKLPNWLSNDWRLNDTLDGLIPTDTYYSRVSNEANLNNLYPVQKKGMREAALEDYGQLRDQITKGSDGNTTKTTKPSTIDTLVLQYQELFDQCIGTEHFQIMQSVSNMVTMFLAERAMHSIRIDDTDLSDHDEAPDWFTATLDKKRDAAAQAGKWMDVHQQLYTYLGWNGSPKYYTDYAVKQKLKNLGKYLFTQHVYSDMQRATVSDMKKFIDDKYQC